MIHTNYEKFLLKHAKHHTVEQKFSDSLRNLQWTHDLVEKYDSSSIGGPAGQKEIILSELSTAIRALGGENTSELANMQVILGSIQKASAALARIDNDSIWKPKDQLATFLSVSRDRAFVKKIELGAIFGEYSGFEFKAVREFISLKNIRVEFSDGHIESFDDAMVAPGKSKSIRFSTSRSVKSITISAKSYHHDAYNHDKGDLHVFGAL